MDSLISGIIAELKLRLIEENFKNNIFNYTKCWLRFVDNVFTTIDKDTNPIFLLSLLNKQDQFIKCTYEFDINSKLNFLDVTFFNNSGLIETSVFNKPLANEIINSKCNTPYQYKIAAIRSYINRALIVCSNKIILKDEIGNIVKSSEKEGYSIIWLFPCIKYVSVK